jgi:hypothetical protein
MFMLFFLDFLFFTLLTSCEKVDLNAESCPLIDQAVIPCDSIDCTTERGFSLASTGIQAVPNFDDLPLYQFTVEQWDDVDVVAIHEDFMGIPWAEFANGETPPPVWVESLDALKKGAGSVPISIGRGG